LTTKRTEAAAVAAAAAGDMYAAHAALQEIESPEAREAMQSIAETAAAALAKTEALEGFAKYQGLEEVNDLYGALGPGKTAAEQMAELRQDPDVSKAIADAAALKELEAAVEVLDEKAMPVLENEGELAARLMFLEALIPLYHEFMRKYPEHELTPDMRQVMPELNKLLEDLRKEKAAADAGEAGEPAEAVDEVEAGE